MKELYIGARKLGVELSSQCLNKFSIYYEELIKWNNKFNLTAITNFDDVVKKHFLDSLTILNAVEKDDLKGLLITDVGTGAGFPGLPVKIAHPEIKLNLIESTAKKTAFLSHIIEKLGLMDINVINTRAEIAAHNSKYREASDIVTSRAVAGMPTLCELTLPFCKTGGVLIAQKKGDITEEISNAGTAIEKLNGRLGKVISLDDALGIGEGRKLVVIKKVGAIPDKYPRRDGIPLKRPLI